jgi:hypothetical protein
MPRRPRKEEVVTLQALAEKRQIHCEVIRTPGVTEGTIRYHLRRAAAGTEGGHRHRAFKTESMLEAIASWMVGPVEGAFRPPGERLGLLGGRVLPRCASCGDCACGRRSGRIVVWRRLPGHRVRRAGASTHRSS